MQGGSHQHHRPESCASAMGLAWIVTWNGQMVVRYIMGNVCVRTADVSNELARS